ncbi:MAG: hypothetical protein ACE5JD_15155, partial [Candidatus Methylomirabilia bacterium]
YLDRAEAALAALSSRIRANPVSTAVATVALGRFLKRHPDRPPSPSAAPPEASPRGGAGKAGARNGPWS